MGINESMEKNTDKQEPSRREREKLARQQDIVTAARDLFLTKGYHNTTLDDIARQAEFGKGTIYNYFSSKDELFFGIVDLLVDETFALAQSAIEMPGDARVKLTAYAKSLIVYARDNADLFRLIAQEMHHTNSTDFKEKFTRFEMRRRECLELIAGALENDIKTKKIRSYDRVQIMALFDGMIRAYCMFYLKDRAPLSAEDIDATVNFIITVFFDGVAERNLEG
jgi:AcrR family transcriptional regulator